MAWSLEDSVAHHDADAQFEADLQRALQASITASSSPNSHLQLPFSDVVETMDSAEELNVPPQTDAPAAGPVASSTSIADRASGKNNLYMQYYVACVAVVGT
ncbi:hypothetical protein EVG20_g6867 [Dentipellis fragilis]|uniref:Uncharacterized protein n=1 Tax=Dentipellis fragilis TaxID=205917 RepID=A0A4Y9YJT8_9AGAM|nr:hypothetical protein EVG20_g6867 [Dentipellis fragilis]